MKKWFILVFLLMGMGLCFIPFEKSITFTETRTETPEIYYESLKGEDEFQLVFTHTIHLTDVIESYRALSTNEIQMLSMQYSDVAIGMPGVAEQGQTLQYENGIYTLRYNDAKLKDFTLHIGDVDYKLNLQHRGQVIALKENLVRGKSYLVQIKRLSIYEKMKGVELHD